MGEKQGKRKNKKKENDKGQRDRKGERQQRRGTQQSRGRVSKRVLSDNEGKSKERVNKHDKPWGG